MNRSKRTLKSLATGLSIILFATNVAFANTPEVNFWKEREKQTQKLARLPQPISSVFPPLTRPMGSLPHLIKRELPKNQISEYATLISALPQNVGTVRKVSIPHSFQDIKKIVIQIQDVHMNAEAQKNIGQAVQELIQQKKVDLIALEGAFGPADFSVYHKFPYQESVKAVADYLLRQNKISGPVHTLFLNQEQIPTVGIDHQAHYDANVDAYKVSAPLLKSRQAELAQKMKTLNLEKTKTYNPQLQKFDVRVQAYRQGQISWGDYVRTLVQHTGDTTHEIDVFVEALQQEGSLNFTRVESERAQLLNQLVPKLSEVEKASLLSHSAAYRSGSLSHTDFYEHLKTLCASHNISLAHFKAMDSYIRYVLLSDAINVERVLNDVTQLEKAVYASLAHTKKERALIQADRTLALTKKLLNFSLTKDEWVEHVILRTNRTKNLDIEKGEILHYVQDGKPFDLSSFEKFYEEAIARDTAMTNNLLKAMDESKANVAVVVTGGFHTQGMMAQLNQKGVATITYAPKISKIEEENGSGYLGVFTQEKTPLDKLFAGEKLFVPPHVVTAVPATTALVAAHHDAVASNQIQGTATDGKITYTVEVVQPSGDIISAEALTPEQPLTINKLGTTILVGFLAFLASCVGTPVHPAEILVMRNSMKQVLSSALNQNTNWFTKELILTSQQAQSFNDHKTVEFIISHYRAPLNTQFIHISMTNEGGNEHYQLLALHVNDQWEMKLFNHTLALITEKNGQIRIQIPTSEIKERLDSPNKIQVSVKTENIDSAQSGQVQMLLTSRTPTSPQFKSLWFGDNKVPYLLLFLLSIHRFIFPLLLGPILALSGNTTAQTPPKTIPSVSQQDPKTQNITIALNEEYGGGTGETWKARWSNITPEQAKAISKSSAIKFTIAPPTLKEFTGFHIQFDGGSAFGFRFFGKKVNGVWGVYPRGQTLDEKSSIKITEEGSYVVVVIPTSEIPEANLTGKIHLQSGQEQNGIKLNAQNIRPDVVLEILSDSGTLSKPAVPTTAPEIKPNPIFPSIAPTKPVNEIVSVVRNERGVWMNVKGTLWSGAPGVAYQPTPNNQHITDFHHGRMALLYRALLPEKEKWSDDERQKYPDLWRLVEKADNKAALPQNHAQMIAEAGFKFVRTYNLASTDEDDLRLVSKIFQWMHEKYDVYFVAGLYDPTPDEAEKVARILQNNNGLLHYDGWNEIDFRGGTVADIEKIDGPAGTLKKADPNHPIAIVVSQTITPEVAAAVKALKHIDVVGVTIYNRPGEDTAPFVHSLQKYFEPKAVIISEYGVRSDQNPAEQRAKQLADFQAVMTMTNPTEPSVVPLHTQFYWSQEKWKGADRFWELVDQNNQPTPSLIRLAEVNRRWVLAKQPEPQIPPAAPLEKSQFSIALTGSYGGKTGDTHFGRYKKIGLVDSQRLLGQTHIKITIAAPKLDDFSGFHIDIKNKAEFSAFDLFGKKIDGAWTLINKDGSANTASGAKISVDGNQVIVLIPRSDIKNLDLISRIDVQSGQKQNGVNLNTSNIAVEAQVEAVTIPGTEGGKKGSMKGFFFFPFPLFSNETETLSLTNTHWPLAIAAAVVALLVFAISRFRSRNKLSKQVTALAQRINHNMPLYSHDSETVEAVIENINVRMRHRPSFELARGLQSYDSELSPMEQKRFAVGLALSTQEKGLAERFSRFDRAFYQTLKLKGQKVYQFHIKDQSDLDRCEGVMHALLMQSHKNRETQKAVVGISISSVPDNLQTGVYRVIDGYRNKIPLAFAFESELTPRDGAIGYSALFSNYLQKFGENTEIKTVYEKLLRDDVRDLQFVVTGKTDIPFRASENLLRIMTSLVPISGATLLINIKTVLLAAKQA